MNQKFFINNTKALNFSFNKGIALLLFIIPNVFICLAEGTKQLMPTASSFGQLQIWDRGRPFATYNAPASNRLYIRICNIGEKIYYGFNQPNDDVYYRIKDPDGNVVVGPSLIPASGNGFISNYNQAVAGPLAPGGYSPLNYTALKTGDYYIEFNPGSATTINKAQRLFNLFDITVVSSATAVIPGRLWSYSWDINTLNDNNRFTGSMYIYSTDSLVTSINFNGMQGHGFTISANSTGVMNTGDFANDRISRIGDFSNPEYKIFLNDPDQNCFPTGNYGNFTAPSTISGCDPAHRCITVSVNKTGKVEVLLDLNGVNGYQANTEDLLIITQVTKGQNCIPWDSKDGKGNLVTTGNVPVKVNYFNGLTNLPLYDVEHNTNGFNVTPVRPAGAGVTLFWDDHLIMEGSASDGKTNLNGCTSPTGCHKWKNRGDNDCPVECPETINTWWYANLASDNFSFPFNTITIDAENRNGIGFPNDTTICKNITTFKLNAKVTGGTNNKWSGGAGSFSPSTSDLFAVYTPTPNEITAGLVTLKLSSDDPHGCFTVNDNITIHFAELPVINAGADQNICSNQNTVQLSATGNNYNSFYWSGQGTFPGGNNSLQTSYQLSSSELSAGSAVLTITATNTWCGNLSDQITININQPLSPDAGADQKICKHVQQINLNGSTSGAGSTYWIGGTGNFSPSNNILNPAYTPSVQDLNQGSVKFFLVFAGNNLCPSTKDSVLITFLEDPIVNAGNDLEICEDVSEINLNGISSNTTVIQWKGDGGTFSSGNNSSTKYFPTVTELASGSFKLTFTGTSQDCGIATDELLVRVNKIPVMDAGTDQYTCRNRVVNLSGTSNDTVNYQWTDKNGNLFSNAVNFTLVASLDSMLILTGINSKGCSDSDTVQIFTIDPPSLSASDQCYRDQLILSPVTSGYSAGGTFEWKKNNVIISGANASSLIVDSPGDYSITYSNKTCTVSKTTRIFANPIIVLGDSINGCENTTSKIGTVYNSDYSYIWKKNNVIIANTDSIAIQFINNSEKYYLSVTDQNHCNAADSLVVSGIPLPVIQVADTGICDGNKILISGQVVNSADYNASAIGLSWSLNGSLIGTGNSIFINQAGTYNFTVGAGNCISTKALNVIPYPQPAPVLPTEVIFCSDTTPSIDLNPGDFEMYTWNTGDNSKLLMADKQGVYSVSVRNIYGCEATATTTLTEICPPELHAPSAFSPNNDHVNDLYNIYGLHIGKFKLIIFNRWGEIIFETNKKENFWDGNYRGEPMPEGVYPWIIEYEGDTENYKGPYKLEGNVTIIR